MLTKLKLPRHKKMALFKDKYFGRKYYFTKIICILSNKQSVHISQTCFVYSSNITVFFFSYRQHVNAKYSDLMFAWENMLNDDSMLFFPFRFHANHIHSTLFESNIAYAFKKCKFDINEKQNKHNRQACCFYFFISIY